MVVHPRLATGRVNTPELPTGFLEDSGNFAGVTFFLLGHSIKSIPVTAALSDIRKGYHAVNAHSASCT